MSPAEQPVRTPVSPRSRLSRNVSYNLVGAGVSLAITAVTIPPYLDLIGIARYGVLAVVWALTGYFSFVDHGLGQAVTNRIAALPEAASVRQEAFWTAMAVNLGLGSLAGLALWLSGRWVLSLIRMGGALHAEAVASLPWLAIMVPAVTTTAVLSGALAGRERFLTLNVLQTSASALSRLVPLAVAWLHGPTLPWIIASVVLVRLAQIPALLWACWNSVPLRGRPVYHSREARFLLRFGGWAAVTSGVQPLLTTVDRFAIGALAGADAVGWYSIPQTIVTRMALLPVGLNSALMPRLSAQAPAERNATAGTALRRLAAIQTPLAVLVIVCMRPGLGLWLGAEAALRSTAVGVIIATSVWANGLAYVPLTLLYARARTERPAQLHLAEIVPFLLMLYFGLRWWGINGAALAWAARVFADTVALFWLGGQLRQAAPLAAGALPLVVAAAAAALFPMGAIAETIICLGLLAAAAVWSVRTAPELRSDAASFLAAFGWRAARGNSA